MGKRAEREALAAARLNHPAIVTLYEAGSDGDAAYLVSELVEGEALDDLLAEGALSDRDIARIGAALAAALDHAHGHGVIHRDVKPGNVIVPSAPHGEASLAKLTDFGVARLVGDDPLTRTSDIVGTLAYMAPEQAEGEEVGAEADLYSLGLVVYEALTGVNPVRGGGPAATARRLGEPPSGDPKGAAGSSSRARRRPRPRPCARTRRSAARCPSSGRSWPGRCACSTTSPAPWPRACSRPRACGASPSRRPRPSAPPSARSPRRRRAPSPIRRARLPRRRRSPRRPATPRCRRVWRPAPRSRPSRRAAAGAPCSSASSPPWARPA